MLKKEKEAYTLWLSLQRNFPRTEYGLRNKIDQAFLDLLEQTFTSIYLSPKEKIGVLEEAIVSLDRVQFFTQLAWENRLIPTSRYGALSVLLVEIGRQLGGWRRGLIKKTSTQD